jgi:hypothetical protein
MSVDATKATWELKKVTAIQKLLLLTLADRADETGQCYPSLKRISEDTRLNRKTIIENRQILIASGYISYTGEVKGSKKQIPVMKLNYVQHREGNLNLDDEESFTSTENGTGTENGTRTSTENGTGNQYRKRDTEPKQLEPKLEVREEKKISQAHLNLMCLQDEKCKTLFETKFGKIDLEIHDLLEDCVMYYALQQKPQMVSPHRFRKWISREHTDTYTKKPESRQFKLWSELTEEEKEIVGHYNHRKSYPNTPSLWYPLTERQIKLAEDIISFLNKSRDVKEIRQ